MIERKQCSFSVQGRVCRERATEAWRIGCDNVRVYFRCSSHPYPGHPFSKMNWQEAIDYVAVRDVLSS